MRAILERYKSILSYVFFGVLTTAVNMAVYAFCYKTAGAGNVGSTIIAWCVSVLFAFLTNKQYVFASRSWTIKGTLEEGIRFAGGRLLTGLAEVAVMYVSVDLLGGPGIMMKLGANIMVIILNYVISKKWIFVK